MHVLTSPFLPSNTNAGPDVPRSDPELRVLVALAQSRGAHHIAIGSGRARSTLDSVRSLADAWEHVGGDVVLELTWPETAASWLRQATRFAAAEADVWIMFGPPIGWAQMTRRLLWSTPWKPAHALLAGAVSDPATLDLVGRHNLPGIAGVTHEGKPWHLDTVDRWADHHHQRITGLID